MTILDNVAEALWAAGSQVRSPSWDEVDPVIRDYWRGQARKAISALRMPSQEMIEAFYGNVEVRREGTIYRFYEGYAAMMAAALNDPA